MAPVERSAEALRVGHVKGFAHVAHGGAALHPVYIRGDASEGVRGDLGGGSGKGDLCNLRKSRKGAAFNGGDPIADQNLMNVIGIGAPRARLHRAAARNRQQAVLGQPPQRVAAAAAQRRPGQCSAVVQLLVHPAAAGAVGHGGGHASKGSACDNRRRASPEADAAQHGAAFECAFDCINRLRERDALQCAAILKGIAVDVLQRIREDDAIDCAAIQKGAVADVRQRSRKVDCFQACAVIEGMTLNLRKRFG